MCYSWVSTVDLKFVFSITAEGENNITSKEGSYI